MTLHAPVDASLCKKWICRALWECDEVIKKDEREGGPLSGSVYDLKGTEHLDMGAYGYQHVAEEQLSDDSDSENSDSEEENE